jgi:hypothetical protein
MRTFLLWTKEDISIVDERGHFYCGLTGRSITGYTRLVVGEIQLSSWCGKTTLASRCEIVEQFWSGSLALMFRLPRGRYIVGYALGEDGMLFRGELHTDCDEAEARRQSLNVAEYFAEIDAEDEELFNSDE